MRAALKSLVFLPEPSTLPDDPAAFAFEAELGCGPEDGPGEEVFGLTVCTGEWLAARCADQGGFLDPRHHLVVTYDRFDAGALRHWLEARVATTTGHTWSEVAEELAKTGRWELDTHGA
ncbi:MAG TPA: Imm8 family immunity protein [Propionibacteriaceae bacterium]|nr:Imm8 family immunity protein [Propionibacteriaceae bacterium]